MFVDAPAKERITRWLKTRDSTVITVEEVQLGLAFYGHAGGQQVRDALQELVQAGHLAIQEKPDTYVILPPFLA